MFIEKRGFLCVWLLSVCFLYAALGWSQITASDHAFTSSPDSTNRSSSGALGLQAREVAVSDDRSGESTASRAIEQKVTEVSADPHSAVSNLPPTLTVSTAALLELHAMRKSAVDLCIQLPAKYRTRLPECAEIFKHEIRLQGLAKKHN